jgi:hypothetical protein
MLFYRKLLKEIEEHRFMVNPVDPCMVNKEVEEGEKLTIIWHMDDLMVSCKLDFELTKFLCYLAKIYGPKLTMHTGQKHNYLGVDLEFTAEGSLEVSMVKYLGNVIKGFPETITGMATSPTGDRLFDIQDEKDVRPLKEERAVAFHHMMAQLLFMATSSWRDVQTAVAFLTTPVKNPDKDNWGKLKQVLKYLNGTRDMKLTISINDLGHLKWYVDGSHNVHWDCKGHRGAMFMLGEGAVLSYSRKLKLNTRSSTKMELVTTDMYMPKMLWSLYFMQSQGYDVEIMEEYQENKSTELLMTNGRFSSGKRTKHINVKFFFIKDRIIIKEMREVHQPTKEMWADVLIKPLQGRAFKEMRARLMNCKVNYEEEQARIDHEQANGKGSTNKRTATGRMAKHSPTQPLQECVEGSAANKPRGATDRHPLGVSRVQTRLTNKGKATGPMKCQ